MSKWYRRPKQGDEVRYRGRSGKVIRRDYAEGTVRIKYTDKNGGIEALDLDAFEDAWTGRRWEIEDDRADAEETDRLDVQIYFDWCYTQSEPDYIDDVNVVRPLEHQLKGADRMDRLRFLAKHLPKDDIRHTILRMAEEGADGIVS